MTLVNVSPAYADQSTIQRDLVRQQEHLLQQQEERQRQQQEDFLHRSDSPSSFPVPHLKEEPIPLHAPCSPIEHIEITGVKLLSFQKLKTLAAPYEGKCLTLEDVSNLLRKITNVYIEAGYVTSHAFVDTEPAEKGILRITVIEGQLEKIILNNGDKNYYDRGRMAFPGLEGKPLNLRDIE